MARRKDAINNAVVRNLRSQSRMRAEVGAHYGALHLIFREHIVQRGELSPVLVRSIRACVYVHVYMHMRMSVHDICIYPWATLVLMRHIEILMMDIVDIRHAGRRHPPIRKCEPFTRAVAMPCIYIVNTSKQSKLRKKPGEKGVSKNVNNMRCGTFWIDLCITARYSRM